MKHLFSPNSIGELRSDARQSQIIGGDVGAHHTQIIGGIYPPRVLAPLIVRTSQSFFIGSKKIKPLTISLFVDKIQPKVKKYWSILIVIELA